MQLTAFLTEAALLGLILPPVTLVMCQHLCLEESIVCHGPQAHSFKWIGGSPLF